MTVTAAPVRPVAAALGARRTLAVSIHDVEPATFKRSREIREWLGERGVTRCTLLVIPAADLHAFDDRSPELAEWLRDRCAAGDAIAQHGFQHRRTRPARRPRRWLANFQGGVAAEFPGLGPNATTAAVRAGRSILTGAGLPVRGFVAPGFAYTGPLKEELSSGYTWWAGLTRVHSRSGHGMTSHARMLGTSTPFKRALSPTAVRLALPAPLLLRIEVHPEDFDFPGHVGALERMLRRSATRPTVTYDELLAD
jgi:predicted deacetylase